MESNTFAKNENNLKKKKINSFNINTSEKKYGKFLQNNKWTTYLAYKLKYPNPIQEVSQDTLLKYEALLTQCSYLSRLAYSPADIFCRMTQHLDVTPNAFNNYIRAIEKIYQKLFNYKCSYDSLYIQEHPEFREYFTPIEGGVKKENSVGFFIQNNKNLNVYLYVYDNKDCKFNDEKTLFIAFKGSSSIKEFKENLMSALSKDAPLSNLNVSGSNTSQNGGVSESDTNDPLLTTKEEKTASIQNANANANENVKKSRPQNANANKISGKAGSGFIEVLKYSIEEICQKITELQNGIGFDRIIITGHSAGGVYASLFGYYLKKYNPGITKKPIHVITFGACCLFDAIGRNEFNDYLNIDKNNEGGIFTLDRVTVFGDPMIFIPVDLDHPGFTLLKSIDNIKAFTKTGRTNEIGEIRKMLELNKGYDGNDLLLSESFVDLFTNVRDFKRNEKYDTDLYRSKYRIKFGTNAKEQILILKKAMNDADEKKIRELFKRIESEVRNNNQSGGISFKKGLGEATKKYRELTINKMPNEIQYSCYKTMSFGFCHGVYMGVTYMTVLRVPGIKNGLKMKKEPRKDYTLYKQPNGKIVSLSSNGYQNNADCTKVSNSTSNNITRKNSNKTPNSIQKKSLKNRIFGTSTRKSNNSESETKPLLSSNKEKQEGQFGQEGQSGQEGQPVQQEQSTRSSGSICSIL